MSKKIFVINGKPTVGKDTFVEFISEITPTLNISSVDKVKEIAKQIGWDGISKTEKDRKFLSDLKKITTEYCDMPFQYMKEKIEEYMFYKQLCIFLHIREPEEIERAVKEFNAKTILITRYSVDPITSNTSDANVNNYKYDYEIANNGTLETFKIVAEQFVKDYIK